MLLRNYLLTTLRTFRRNRLFSLINILGLSIGISASLVIYLIADHEFNYDRFEPGRERIYKVVNDGHFMGIQTHGGAVPGPLVKAVEQELSGIDKTIPLYRYQNGGLAKVAIPGGNAGRLPVFRKQEDVVYTVPQYFQLMPYRWIAGSPVTALNEPFAVVLTESRARVYFPGMDISAIVGRRMVYDDNVTVTVSGIVEDLPMQSDLAAHEFISFATIDKTHLRDDFEMNTWDDWMSSSQLYVRLSPGVSAAAVDKQLAALAKKYEHPDPQHPGDGVTFRLLALKEIHFTNSYLSHGQRVAYKPTLYGLLAVAAFLLLLACLNFINLSTAQAVKRAREIGIRKTMGSSRSRLIWQFLGETLLLVIAAAVFSVLLMPLLLSAFSGFLPPDLHSDWMQHTDAIIFMGVLILVISVAAGFYPAFLLSGFRPVAVLKDGWFSADGRTSGVGLRKIFTVSQFVIAQFFIIATLMVGKQLRYSMNSDLGFRKDAILNFQIPDDSLIHRSAFLTQLRTIPEVEMTASGFTSPGSGGASFGDIVYKPRQDIKTSVQIRMGDSNYIPLYQIRLLAGRNIRQGDSTQEVLINARYASVLGFRRPDDALNKPLTVNGKDLPIVGVMEDFHQSSMRLSIFPLAFIGRPGKVVHVRLRTTANGRDGWEHAIREMQKAYNQFYPGADWDYTFVDDTVAQWYKQDRDLVRLLYWATGLTILISCLGLLGLVIYTTNMRTREIGIRKVLGASVAAIVGILSGEFMRLVGLAFLIAVPAAWWAAHEWLQGFAFRTPMSWWVFAFGGVLLLLIALVTLSFQTVRAALANPVKALRSE